MKKKNFRGMFPGIALAIIMAGAFFVFNINKAEAIAVPATPQLTVEVKSFPTTTAVVKATIWESVLKAGRVSFTNALRTLVNQFAFDTATYIGSGGSGQKPVYFTTGFGPWLRDQGSNVAGQFIENFGKELDETNPDQTNFIDKYHICSPDLSVSIKISLGLTNYANNSGGLIQSKCNLKKIYESGKGQIEAYSKPGYLKSLAENSFNAETTDIGSSLSLFNVINNDTNEEKEAKKLERAESAGWIDPKNLISGTKISPPGWLKAKLDQTTDLQTRTFFTQTGDIFTDASAIFLNQLAISAFNKVISNLSKSESNTATTNDSVGNYYSQGIGGLASVSRNVSSLKYAKFNERTDYNVLSSLQSCTDENKPGPTNCVITAPFAQAIEQQLTVGNAMSQDLLKANMHIGFDPQGNDLSYVDGYPYRSLIILRKYRIIPVGWELASDYIKANPDKTKNVNLRMLIECFSPDDTVYAGYGDSSPENPNPDEAWCHGLVDPNWVLKLPKMYCGMEGYGPEILSASTYPTNVTDVFKAGLTRSGSYCADEKSCIKEGTNGSCGAYGYCTEEQRKWVFTEQSNSCEARNNTCQTFQSNSGQQVSYLQNTLDYGNCSAGQVGCQRYATVAKPVNPYDSQHAKVNWDDTTKQSYFNKNITQCDAKGEGCHEFIRTKDQLGTNLIADGSFELSTCLPPSGSENGNSDNNQTQSNNTLIPTAKAQVASTCGLKVFNGAAGRLPKQNDRWYMSAGTVRAGIVNTKSNGGGANSLYIEGNGGIYSKDSTDPSLLPTGTVLEGDSFYTLTASVYIESGAVRLGFGNATGQYVDWSTGGSWKTIAVVFYNPVSAPLHEFFLKGTNSGAKFYIDQLQLTKDRGVADYKEYGAVNVVYEKFLPSYLETVCYDNSTDFRLKTDAPAICYQFARKCSADQVGCEAFTAVDSGISVTGKTKVQDACPGTCVGYNTYVQQANIFNARAAAYFIPKTARSCSAEATGCTAFTNLDKLTQGGESVEYYSSLRACIKPDVTKCDQYYTWEGSDDSGYQLHAYALQRNQSGSASEPKSTLSAADEALICNADIYKKLPDEPGYNYDCRQFYAADGTVSYHIYSKTISCSDDCHPYRREISSPAECTGANGAIDTTGRCIYNAIPGEGTSCAAVDVGCQEYAGNIANNTRNVFSPATSSFEDDNNQFEGWRSGTQNPNRSNVSLNVGGHSLAAAKIEKTVGEDVVRNNSYTITFLAKAVSPATALLQLNLSNQSNQKADFSTSGASFGTDWKLYTFNLADLNHDVTKRPATGSGGELLTLEFSGQVYIDNIRLTEVPDRYYLIKNSWNTPDECDRDFNGVASPRYMLGCSEYKKADDSTVTLRSFSSLCQDSAAGCEAMIDTHNSTNPAKTVINDGTDNNNSCDPGEIDCVETAADTMINAVYDPTKLCGQESKGCQRMGAISSFDGQISFNTSDPYLKNDPDQYNSTLCTKAGVSCNQFSTTNGGTVFFKDPGKEVCEWRPVPNTPGVYAWYKKDQKRCAATGAICTADSQCPTGQSCQDATCPVSTAKTIGSGATKVTQPSLWAGLCESEQAGCTEYIDPLSKFNENLIVNPSYKNLDSDPQIEYWNVSGADEATQTIELSPQTIYIIKGDNNEAGAKIKLACTVGNNESLRVLDADNDFAVKANATTDFIVGKDLSQQLYIQSDTMLPVQCRVVRTKINQQQPSDLGKYTVYLRKAVVDYQLEQNLDRTSHGNLVNFDKGAILFNERAQSGKKKKSLEYNADLTYDTNPINGAAPKSDGVRNANSLLNVTPNRSCSKWLDCLSYVSDPKNPQKKVCLGIGSCESLKPDGSCASFSKALPKNQHSLNSSANLSGYSKVGYDGQFVTAMYPLAAMSQRGGAISLDNGNFELNGEWTLSGEARIMDNATEISAENINSFYNVRGQLSVKYLAPEGRGLLRLAPASSAKQTIGGTPNKTYIISFKAYSKGNGLTVKLEKTGSPTIVLLNNTLGKNLNKWTQYSLSFNLLAKPYTLVFDAGTENFSYIDDVRIESSLINRCDNPDTNANPEQCSGGSAKLNYIGSSCRIYPTEDSLSCDFSDESEIQYQGIRGYCLENDPKNPAACLLWYPIDRIISDQQLEVPSINFGGDVYYCVEAKDECNGKNTGYYCNQFIKVDKKKFFYSRMKNNSNFTLPFANDIFSELPADRKIDFGINGFTVSLSDGVKQGSASGYYGAYISNLPLDKKVSVNQDSSTHNITNFLPYFGVVGAGADRQLCAVDDERLETADDGSDLIRYTSSKYDACFVKGGASDEGDSGGEGYCRGGGFSPECSDQNFTCKTKTVYDFDPACYGSTRNVFVKCKAEASVTPGILKLTAENDNSGGSDQSSVCVFDCYNQAKSYRLTKPLSNGSTTNGAQNNGNALNWIRNLFVGRYYDESVNGQVPANWQLYSLDGANYHPSTLFQPTVGYNGCPNNVRTGNSWCYIKPVLSDYKVNGKTKQERPRYIVDGSGFVTFSFATKTDVEQLPLRRILVDYGIRDGAENESYDAEGNFADTNPRLNTKWYDYYQINEGDNNNFHRTDPQVCDGAASCYIFTPSVKIVDNWGYYSELSAAEKIEIVVKKPQ